MRKCRVTWNLCYGYNSIENYSNINVVFDSMGKLVGKIYIYIYIYIWMNGWMNEYFLLEKNILVSFYESWIHIKLYYYIYFSSISFYVCILIMNLLLGFHLITSDKEFWGHRNIFGMFWWVNIQNASNRISLTEPTLFT